jgi:CubicO group peptidase (beta-lactamase class C family)
MDLVGLEPNRFGLGFFLPFPRLPFGGPRSFGHDGLGGCVALADPDDGLAFAYTTDTVPENPGADPAAWRLLEAARAGIHVTR